MQIITEHLVNCNGKKEIIIYGPSEIPREHELYNKKLRRHGVYERTLILSSMIKVIFVISRFCEKTENGYRTYSLLPSFITPYQRHINTYIEQVLTLYFLENKSKSYIVNALNIEIETVRRWLSRFSNKIEEIEAGIEKRLINTVPGYRAASKLVNNMFLSVKLIFENISLFIKKESKPLNYGIIDWINLRLKPFLGRVKNILVYK